MLSETNVKGFPIVASNETLQSLVGYIGRTELRYVLGILFLIRQFSISNLPCCIA